jgi:hypothetical protein
MPSFWDAAGKLWDALPSAIPDSLMERARQESEAPVANYIGKYGYSGQVPPLRSVDDPPAEKAFHDRPQAFPDGPTAYGPMGGGFSIGDPVRQFVKDHK